MELEQLWDLFRETGDPMGYLLYRAECGPAERPRAARRGDEAEKETERRTQQENAPLL